MTAVKEKGIYDTLCDIAIEEGTSILLYEMYELASYVQAVKSLPEEKQIILRKTLDALR